MSLVTLRAEQQSSYDQDDAILRSLISDGFANIRSAYDGDCRVYTLECDNYKLPVDGIRSARSIVEKTAYNQQVKLIVTNLNVPELTMSYTPENAAWTSTKSLDRSWEIVRKQHIINNSFGKINIVFYPQFSLKNLIINQVYQALFQLSPALEMNLLPGMKLSYQLKLPVYNDGYPASEGKIHPGFVTLSQSFRLPGKFNLYGKFTLGSFNNNRHGMALEMAYYLPDQRFFLDTQMGLLRLSYWEGFRFRYSDAVDFNWSAGINFYQPSIQTLFSLKAQKFLAGDKGIKYEMVRHFHHCAVGLYAEKSIDAQLNVGFRFQIALPPYKHNRHGYLPKITTSGQMGMSYVANNERVAYKEFRTEASDNIMSASYFNPFYIEYQLSR